MSNTKIKPCPFCGGKAYVHSHTVFHLNYVITTYYVDCSICETRTRSFTSEEAAVNAWERRNYHD